MRQIEVEVSDRHILDGSRESPAYCPVALAIDEHLNDDYYPIVYSNIAIVRTRSEVHPYRSTTARLPDHVGTWIGDYDTEAHENPRGISFDLMVPEEMLSCAS